jgi:hypothetical protein
MKWSLWILCLSFTVPHAWAAEPVTADDAIQAAIDQLEQSVDKVNDPFAKARIHKAIRELEIILNAGSETPVAPKITFEVKPAVLKKKFQGKAAFDPKSGELSLIYDFTRKEQLKDFEVKKDAQYTLLNKSLILDGGEQITHIAKFKAFTVSGVLGVKTMKWGGVSSTNGSALNIGGANPDTVYLKIAGGEQAYKIVPDRLRSGSIPFQFSVTPKKSSLNYGPERLSKPTAKPDDVHQIVLVAGDEGMGFANLTIAGSPEPEWFQQFLEADQ